MTVCEWCKTEIKRDGRTITGWKHLDTTQNRHSPRPEFQTCGAIGALMVGSLVVGQLQCELDAGHGETHRVTLEWTPEADPDLDLFDPDERFDVAVDV